MAHISEFKVGRGTTHSASYVEDGVGVEKVLLAASLDGFFRTHDEQFNFATLSLGLYLLHHRQGTVACADYQATASPRYPFLKRKRCVSESFTELLGSLFLSLAYLAAVDHDVVVVADSIDPNGAKGESFESHGLISRRKLNVEPEFSPICGNTARCSRV